MADGVMYPDVKAQAEMHAKEAAIVEHAILLLEKICSGEDKKGEPFQYVTMKIAVI
jgi:hypothetical protein